MPSDVAIRRIWRSSVREAGLHEATKQHIREALEWITATPGLKSQRAQRLMIAEAAKTLAGGYAGERVLCAERRGGPHS